MVTAYFLDSSALVKRYVAEVGTAWIQAMTVPAASNALLIARNAWVEVLSALIRRQREGGLSPIIPTGIHERGDANFAILYPRTGSGLSFFFAQPRPLAGCDGRCYDLCYLNAERVCGLAPSADCILAAKGGQRMFSTGLAEIVLIVKDVMASAQFYREVVGLTPETEADAEWAWFWAGAPGQPQAHVQNK